MALSRIEQLVSVAAADYRPKAVKGKVLLFKSELQPTGPFVGEDMGWSHVLGRHALVTTLPGNHREIFDPMGARIMAECIRAALD
jgi:thioesterase domain-containing protein